MSQRIASFDTAEALLRAAAQAGAEGFAVADALTPYPIEALDALVPGSTPHVRTPMAIAGFGMALAAFALQSWSSIWAYPFDSGGRPLFSWPVYPLVPFEVGILSAGLAGCIAFLVRCGMPRLHDPVFALPEIERASDDRFFLVLAAPQADRADQLDRLLIAAGAQTLESLEA